MALRTIRTQGDEVLTKVSREVKEMTPRTRQLIDDMIETLYDADGVGLAAPQVGVLRRIVVIDCGAEEEELTEEEIAELEAMEAAGEFEEIPDADEDDFDEEDTLIVMINPMILEMDGEQTGEEGCLSVPDKYGIVTRPNYVKAWALDENMKAFEIEAEGLLARAICHELDHLDGHLYVEKVEGKLYDVNEERKKAQAEKDREDNMRAQAEEKKAKEAARKAEAAKKAKGK